MGLVLFLSNKSIVINTTEEATTEGDTTTTEDTTTANLVGTNTRTNQCSGDVASCL